LKIHRFVFGDVQIRTYNTFARYVQPDYRPTLRASSADAAERDWIILCIGLWKKSVLRVAYEARVRGSKIRSRRTYLRAIRACFLSNLSSERKEAFPKVVLSIFRGRQGPGGRNGPVAVYRVLWAATGRIATKLGDWHVGGDTPGCRSPISTHPWRFLKSRRRWGAWNLANVPEYVIARSTCWKLVARRSCESWQEFWEVWETCEIPDDWWKGIIIPIFKGKGDRKYCGGYREVTLLSVPGKLFASVILGSIGNL
jgi:hypothetical protein